MLIESALAASMLSLPFVVEGLPHDVSGTFSGGSLSISEQPSGTRTVLDSFLEGLHSLGEMVETVLSSSPSFVGTDAESMTTSGSELEQGGVSLEDRVRDPGIETEGEPATKKRFLDRNRKRRFKHEVAPTVPEISEVLASDTLQGDQGAIAGL